MPLMESVLTLQAPPESSQSLGCATPLVELCSELLRTTSFPYHMGLAKIPPEIGCGCTTYRSRYVDFSPHSATCAPISSHSLSMLACSDFQSLPTFASRVSFSLIFLD
ncbi:hypothetical protein ANCCAN_19332 [Ancylostoma caninum]|uniref:Uncharacterized protein n=1 Tax=Ancylostoma caninum TaxID=29170 RepID=A0A368FTM0_ANCCA|nr:hypothetical protein ANCCAN_19332 [Ancylostoma caninum]